MKLRIARLDGSPIGYPEAVMRSLPDLILSSLATLALIDASRHMTDARYFALSFVDRSAALAALAPVWFQPVRIASNVWT